ncbi:MAG: Type 1 glutamine amidotransferase-like domain-containing protein [Chloroflexi bacterium]|nr:Type 1 glutamine amidotransferase-like domain-containing protein [Chloroflexota bacterium]
MKFYLSSYRLGDETERLKKLVPKGRIGYIPNALDVSTYDPLRVQSHIEKDMNSLRDLSLEVELVNLRDYFGKRDELKNKLDELGAIFISGGNTFVLRQAMRLSSLDELLNELRDKRDFLYAGYSAAGAVLAPSLESTAVVDPLEAPYPELKRIIWEGLGFIDFAFLPHWRSDHPESADVEKEMEYCKRNNIPFKAIRDGEVIIIE